MNAILVTVICTLVAWGTACAALAGLLFCAWNAGPASFGAPPLSFTSALGCVGSLVLLVAAARFAWYAKTYMVVRAIDWGKVVTRIEIEDWPQ